MCREVDDEPLFTRIFSCSDANGTDSVDLEGGAGKWSYHEAVLELFTE